MPMIKPASIRDLKSRVNIVDIVGGVVSLRKAGASFKGLCPFHNEKTPSFHVSPDRGLYKCFGCGKGGDSISFVMETEHLGFTEAAETLARRFNIPLEYEEGGPTREERSLRQELYDLHERAAELFHEALKGAAAIGTFMRGYWTEKRRFPLELADEFKIGAVDESGGGLAALLAKQKYSEEAFRQCGLFFVREGAPFSVGALKHRFRGRLMIPIRDIQGRVVAFTARQTDLTPADDPAREAKYVNSPETPIFTKGELLFNLDRARTHSGEAPFVMVEGQLDAMRCWHAGLKTVVAPQGTAITERQLHLLHRLNPRLECFLDGDSAGRKAAFRLLPLALKVGMEVKFLQLSVGKDPDELFRDHGMTAYEELRGRALDGITFACRAILPDPTNASALDRQEAVKQLFEIIANSSSETALESYLTQIQRELRLGRGVLADFETFRRSARGGGIALDQQAPATPDSGVTETYRPVGAEEHLLLLCLHHEELGPPLATLIQHDWIDDTSIPGRLLNRALAAFHDLDWPGRDEVMSLAHDEEEHAVLTKLLFVPPREDDPIKVANEGLRLLHQRFIRRQLDQIGLEIASNRPDSESDSFLLLKKKADLIRQSKHPPQLSAHH
ncbi:MAG TPA: DNA primase [Opitutaceae bacterium]|nr:DNA primase [Opitutaceae bacterium]